MNLLTAKIIAMAVMGFGVLFCGLLPIKLRPWILKGEENSKRRRHRERFISGLLCFGAGVLLATVFTHMLPETRMEFEKARKLGLLGGHDHHDHHDDHDGGGRNETDNVAVVNLPGGSNGPTFANNDHNHATPGRSPALQFNDQSVPPYKEIALPLTASNGHQHDRPLNNSQPNNHDHDHDHNHDHDHDHDHATTSRRPVLQFNDQSVPPSKEIALPLTESNGHQHDRPLNNSQPNNHGHDHDHDHTTPGRSPALQFKDQSVPPYKEIALPLTESNGHQHDRPLNNSQPNNHGHDHGHDHKDHVYPMAELVLCLGFLFIYVVEEFVHKFFLRHKHSDDDEAGDDHHHHSHVPDFGQNGGHKHDEHHAKSNGISYSVQSNGDVLLNNNKDTASFPGWGGQGMDNPVFSGDVETAENQRMRTILLTNGKVLPITSSPTSSPHLNGGSGHSREASLQLNKSGDTQNESKAKIDIATNVRGLLIVVALGFHAVFEGMAVGLQEDVMDVWYLFFAISAHKYVIKFCIGLELLENNTPRLQMVLSIITLALMTPIGIAVGIIVTENSGFGGSEHILIIAVLQGLAGGTLLYITFFEIMDRERSKPGARVIKLFCFALGFAGMASIEAIGGHSH